MTKICTVPIGSKTVDGKFEYNVCGEDAVFRVGNWLVCEGHKKYYTDANRWPAKKLEEN